MKCAEHGVTWKDKAATCPACEVVRLRLVLVATGREVVRSQSLAEAFRAIGDMAQRERDAAGSP